ncbi:hypothetical protein X975_15691, partial [Stegodyphus mimosarum]
MGPQYKESLENNEKVLQDVINHSSFNFMKESFNKSFAELASMPKDQIRNNPDIPPGIRHLFSAEENVFKPDPVAVQFVRKGIVGDWRSYFSPEQNARLEKKFRERTAGTDIPDLWKDVM